MTAQVEERMTLPREENILWEITEAMPELRLVHRAEPLSANSGIVISVRQQLYKITQYRGEVAVSGRTEWRDVGESSVSRETVPSEKPIGHQGFVTDGEET